MVPWTILPVLAQAADTTGGLDTSTLLALLGGLLSTLLTAYTLTQKGRLDDLKANSAKDETKYDRDRLAWEKKETELRGELKNLWQEGNQTIREQLALTQQHATVYQKAMEDSARRESWLAEQLQRYQGLPASHPPAQLGEGNR